MLIKNIKRIYNGIPKNAGVLKKHLTYFGKQVRKKWKYNFKMTILYLNV